MPAMNSRRLERLVCSLIVGFIHFSLHVFENVEYCSPVCSLDVRFRISKTGPSNFEAAGTYPRRRDAKTEQRVRTSRWIGGTVVASDTCPARKEPETALQPA
jgi:hypothetical protein